MKTGELGEVVVLAQAVELRIRELSVESQEEIRLRAYLFTSSH